MKALGKLRHDADPAALAAATMASIQGGLPLTQVRRDTRQLCIALDAARTNLGVNASTRPQQKRTAK
jgi:TetR/AcrR family transcriptional regulator, transcriptional repressor for nem operon